MGRDLADAFPVARRVFEEADDRLRLPLSRLCFEGPEDQLMLTEHAQPAILAASVAGSRFRRVREVVILKTLGGTRRHIASIFSVEFLTLGAVAGLLGGLLASGFSRIVLTRLLEAKFQLDIGAIAEPFAVVVVTARSRLTDHRQ